MFARIRRSSRRVVVVWVAANCLVFGQARPARAWGHNGHRIVAKFAETRLSSAARVAIHDILEDSESIADASTWPDEHKTPHDAPWHFVNVPVDKAAYAEEFCDPAKGCVVQKIKEFRKTLKDPDADPLDKRRALRFLVHLIGDIHQPLHVADHHDLGGNRVQAHFFGRGMNLHAIWDEGVLQHDPVNGQDELGESVDEGAWVTRLAKFTTKEKGDLWTGVTKEEDWATESLVQAKKAYIDPGTGVMIKSGADLGDDYETMALPIVQERLAQAGVRLAAVLNDIFAD